MSASMPPASQPWRPRSGKDGQQQQQPTNPPAPASKGGNNRNHHHGGGNQHHGGGGFETDGQISNRTNARNQSHAANTFAKYGGGNKHGGGGGHHHNHHHNNNNTSNVVPPVSSAATAERVNQFNVEDALDAFENIRVHPMAQKAADWVAVADSGVEYKPAHKNVSSFLKMCSEAQQQHQQAKK